MQTEWMQQADQEKGNERMLRDVHGGKVVQKGQKKTTERLGKKLEK